MRWCLIRVALVCLVAWRALRSEAKVCSQRVAVIGGGIGGSYAAYLISNSSASSGVAVDMFDAGDGRVQQFPFEGEAMELGAAMLYGGNLYMEQLTKLMGLTVKTYGHDPASTHIYDGQRVVLQLGGSTLRRHVSLVARYGLTPLAYGGFTKRMCSNFSTIYSLQDAGKAFPTTAGLMRAIHLYDLTQQRCNDTLQGVLRQKWWSRLWGARAFADELAASINRCNYNQQNSELNAFVGAMSYLPTADPDIWSVQEGNGAVAQRLLAASGAKLHLNTSVAAVQQAGEQYTLLLQDGATRGPYDAVFIAAPLATANLSLPAALAPPAGQYQTTFATFLKGALQPDYFQDPDARGARNHTCVWQLAGSWRIAELAARLCSMCRDVLEGWWQALMRGCGGSNVGRVGVPLASHVFVTEGAEAPFSAIFVKKVLSPSEALYKVFSSEPLSTATLSALFGPQHQVLVTKKWAANPKYSPPENLPPFELAPGLYYNNAIEVAASAMEFSAIAARNNVLLAGRHLAARCEAVHAA